MELAVALDPVTLNTGVLNTLNAVDLVALGGRVAPSTLAGERTLPLADMFADLFTEGGLVRGRTVVCDGPAATSIALALVAPAIAAGSWLAMIDLPTIGLDAASELGVPLERVVSVSTGDDTERADRWPDVVAAAADGFDVLLVRIPPDVSPAALRKVSTRIRQRGTVMVVVGDPGPLAGDGVLHSESSAWTGLGDGHGRLQHRQLTVRASGRRLPGQRWCRMALPADPSAAPAA
jgi:hypothetical protein